MKKNFQETLLIEFKKILSPLTDSGKGFEIRNQLFEYIGWELENLEGISINDVDILLTSADTLKTEIENLIDSPPESLEDVLDLFEAIGAVFDIVKQVSNLATIDTPAEFGEIINDIMNYLITHYLQLYRPKLYRILVLLTVIKDGNEGYIQVGYVDGTNRPIRKEKRKSTIDFSVLKDLIQDPATLFKTEYMPTGSLTTTADANFMADKLFPRIGNVLNQLGFNATYGLSNIYGLNYSTAGNELGRHMLTVSYHFPPQDIDFGATFSLSAADKGNLGLVIAPFGNLSVDAIVGGWDFKADFLTDLNGFAIGPDGITFPAGLGISDVHGKLSLSKFSPSGNAFQIGSTIGTHLQIGECSITGDYSFGGGFHEYKIEAQIKDAGLIIKSGDGDRFLNKVLPNEGIEIEFDLTIGYSNRDGFYFGGSGGMEIKIPVHKTIFGFLDIESVFVGIKAEVDGLKLYGSLDAGLNLGPFIAKVNEVGINANLEFVELGNLGPIDASIGFKSPKGIGLSIDASAVKGGGYLYFNQEDEKYAGVAELSIKDKISLKAIGILTTKLPGNDDGYSLLLLITAEFTPITLGFGFTLNGVGGLVALNRSMNVQAIRDGVKNNSIDNIMFPDDPIANVAQIISNLETIFPVQEGRFVFGVMGLIGWGSPTLITMEIGLMLEVPKPVRLAILGVIKAAFGSTDDKNLLTIQVNFVGIIDFEAKYITFDASIFESNFLKFTLSGDMAFRLKWGDEPNFLFSVGGFHPSFAPPPLDLPSMERLTINFFGNEEMRMTLFSYVAITSNTVQFGALLDFYYKISTKLEVVGALGFDVLIQFSPFYLKAELYTMLSLLYNKDAVLSVSLYGMLEGPNPWHVQGKAEFVFLKLKGKVNFDKTFGEESDTVLPDIDVTPLLIAEVEKSQNWEGIFPSQSNLQVTLKDQGNEVEEMILSHPNGSLVFNQKIVPLETSINKFGKQNPVGNTHFTLAMTNVADVNYLSEDTNDFFAPADFIELTDNQKLTRKSFERMTSGLKVTDSDEYNLGFKVEKSVTYEKIVIDSRRRLDHLGLVAETATHFETFVGNNAVAKSPLGKRNKPISNFAPNRVSVVRDSFTIANIEDLSVFSDLGGELAFKNEAEANSWLEKTCFDNPDLIDKIVVLPTYELV